MIMQDSYESACQHSEKAHQIFTQHLLAPSPINYSVIYLYVCNRLPALNKEIEQHIAQDKLLTSEFIDQLFHKYIAETNNVESQVLAPFEKSINATMEKLKSQAISDKTMANNLELADRALNQSLANDNSADQAAVQKVLSFLSTNLTDSQSKHESLSKELAKTYQEVNQLKEKLKQSKEEAYLDALTGLLNRRGCDAKLADVTLEDAHCSLAIDIDHFKSINDTFGHFVGDKVIQRIAKVIKSNTSSKDVAVRFGGEEFVVVLTNQSVAQAKMIAETMRKEIHALRLMQRQTQTYLPPISVSIGIAEVNHDHTWKDVFERADKALYQAKETGRNRCVIAETVAA